MTETRSIGALAGTTPGDVFERYLPIAGNHICDAVLDCCHSGGIAKRVPQEFQGLPRQLELGDVAGALDFQCARVVECRVAFASPYIIPDNYTKAESIPE